MTVHGSWTVDRLVEAYAHHQRRTRGLRPQTLRNRAWFARTLVRAALGTDPIDPSRLTPADVVAFITSLRHRFSPGSMRTVRSSLRSFFRFLRVEGFCGDVLEAALPTVAHWRLATLPRSLTEQQVEQVLASFDASTPCGQRDQAIVRKRYPDADCLQSPRRQRQQQRLHAARLKVQPAAPGNTGVAGRADERRVPASWSPGLPKRPARKRKGSARTGAICWRSLGWLRRPGADGASATALQPPPHLLTTLPVPAGGGRCGRRRGTRRGSARGRAGERPVAPKVGAPDQRFAADGPWAGSVARLTGGRWAKRQPARSRRVLVDGMGATSRTGRGDSRRRGEADG